MWNVLCRKCVQGSLLAAYRHSTACVLQQTCPHCVPLTAIQFAMCVVADLPSLHARILAPIVYDLSMSVCVHSIGNRVI